mmetsp:Transcript_4725/g.13176  ORF Transcript_4725/g.13176 Transcript_4725/m.13176 type:complete len:207 (-) Transcript_4725:47-667(-)
MLRSAPHNDAANSGIPGLQDPALSKRRAAMISPVGRNLLAMARTATPTAPARTRTFLTSGLCSTRPSRDCSPVYGFARKWSALRRCWARLRQHPNLLGKPMLPRGTSGRKQSSPGQPSRAPAEFGAGVRDAQEARENGSEEKPRDRLLHGRRLPHGTAQYEDDAAWRLDQAWKSHDASASKLGSQVWHPITPGAPGRRLGRARTEG